MRHKILGLLLALLTFGIGVSSTLSTVIDGGSKRMDHSAVVNQIEHPRFSFVDVGCMPNAGCMERYRSDEGEEVVMTVIKKRTSKEAVTEFYWWVQNTRGAVYSLGQYKTWFGETGGRFLIRFSTQAPQNELFAIARYNDGNSYKLIGAPSGELAFEFESFLISTNLSGF
jgi:hypothetical protein